MRQHLRRQSFLGPQSDDAIRNAWVAIVGLCGGGSHIGQQAAHIGVGNFKLFDQDRADDSNRNRMVLLTKAAANDQALKTEVMKAAIKAVNPDAEVRAFPIRWQERAEELRGCTAIFGCVDSFIERQQLEAYARRFMVPYIDVGMDVTGEEGKYFITGQVIMSLPGHVCMRCMGFLNDEVLGREANDYGGAGGKPQVVWPNGTLASAAIGNFMSILTPWNTQLKPPLFLEYDGNRMRLAPSSNLAMLEGHECPHFCGPDALGDVKW
jgi:molybdopterin-synthase adenylyltransferase